MSRPNPSTRSWRLASLTFVTAVASCSAPNPLLIASPLPDGLVGCGGIEVGYARLHGDKRLPLGSQVWIDPESTIFDNFIPIWPPGYTATLEPSLRVFDNGALIAVEGQRLQVGGEVFNHEPGTIRLCSIDGRNILEPGLPLESETEGGALRFARHS